jgi:hypothetical protein
MKKVSSLTSTFRLLAAGRIGAGRPHTKESRREEKTVNDRKSLNQALGAVFVNYALASTSRVPNEVLLLTPRHAPTLGRHSAAGPRETNRHQAAGWW